MWYLFTLLLVGLTTASICNTLPNVTVSEQLDLVANTSHSATDTIVQTLFIGEPMAVTVYSEYANNFTYRYVDTYNPQVVTNYTTEYNGTLNNSFTDCMHYGLYYPVYGGSRNLKVYIEQGQYTRQIVSFNYTLKCTALQSYTGNGCKFDPPMWFWLVTIFGGLAVIVGVIGCVYCIVAPRRRKGYHPINHDWETRYYIS